MYKRHDSSDLKEAIRKSKCWREVCENLKSGVACGSQYNFRNRAIKEGIDYSHFKGSVWNKGGKSPKYITALEYLESGSFIKSHTLKLKLMRDGVISKHCNICKITDWNNKPVVWELDHIDSNHSNNELSNLQLLCPNCHSQKTREDRG